MKPHIRRSNGTWSVTHIGCAACMKPYDRCSLTESILDWLRWQLNRKRL